MIIKSIIAISLSLVVLIFLLSFGKKKTRVQQKTPVAETANPFHRCPLCDAGLDRGERIHSKAYSCEDYKLMYIYGCPRCYHTPRPESRHCPVCKKKLEAEDFLVGKMWQTERKTRLHVSGCNRCTKIKD